MNDEKKSLAAHRGEAALWVNPEQLAAARHDIAQHRMSYVRAWNTDYPPEGATQPLYEHPPQAQAGAGDGVNGARLGEWRGLLEAAADVLRADVPTSRSTALIPRERIEALRNSVARMEEEAPPALEAKS